MITFGINPFNQIMVFQIIYYVAMIIFMTVKLKKKSLFAHRLKKNEYDFTNACMVAHGHLVLLLLIF